MVKANEEFCKQQQQHENVYVQPNAAEPTNKIYNEYVQIFWKTEQMKVTIQHYNSQVARCKQYNLPNSWLGKGHRG